ncbi:hypothetical protein [Pseudonocardia sp. ICBG601]|uniref:sodium:solute symporter family transporter n=1 Tax=Pseudonocardia sp. ICBG601 TaxID=2846759 RepID=UPI0021F682C6|nr:hypothetical protein [Pseudonocardia sp. ICBG601]
MGLPHIIVRFHTSPDGRGARRTAAITVAMLGAFYLFPIVLRAPRHGAHPRAVPLAGHDTAIVTLPGRVTGGGTAAALTAMLTAGAFAAFLATSLGLLLALSGALAHDLMPSDCAGCG